MRLILLPLTPLAWPLGFLVGLWRRRQSLAQYSVGWLKRHALVAYLGVVGLVWSVLCYGIAPTAFADVSYYVLGVLLTWGLAIRGFVVYRWLPGDDEDEIDVFESICIVFLSTIVAFIWPLSLPVGLLGMLLVWVRRI